MLEPIISYGVNLAASLATDKIKKSMESKEQNFDFLFESSDGKKMAIEVLESSPDDRKLFKLSEMITRRKNIDQFVLITPDSPTSDQTNLFNSIISPSKTAVSWVDINNFPKLIGVDFSEDLKTPKGIAALQLAALTNNKDKYVKAPIGADISSFKLENDKKESKPISQKLMSLNRQFSFEAITLLSQKEKATDELLSLGDRVKDVTVVLTDIKNFSSLVKAARAEDLRDTMSKYYFKARDLVWEYGGVLDKFIGDAVLAIFDYPFSSSTAQERAIKFSQDLIKVGKTLMEDLANDINELIPTGTRVGIATGDIWPLDIGQKEIEVSFVGDVINLAARLEKNCKVNGILMSHRTRTRALSENGPLIDSLNLKECQLDPEDVKGQIFPIRAWQIPPEKETKLNENG